MTPKLTRALIIAAILAFLALSVVLDVREHEGRNSIEETML